MSKDKKEGKNNKDKSTTSSPSTSRKEEKSLKKKKSVDNKNKSEKSQPDSSSKKKESKNSQKSKNINSKQEVQSKEEEDSKPKQEDYLKIAQKIRPGYLVKVVYLSPDGKRDFTNKGIVLRVRGKERNKTFTVRSNVEGVGMEKVYSFASPALKEVEILKKNPARRARLYFLRSDNVSTAKKKQYLRGL